MHTKKEAVIVGTMFSVVSITFCLVVITALSISQLIYMSKVGLLLLRTKIPVSFKDLLITFLIRTIISLPIIEGLAYIYF
ncbi:hypothetical protein AWH48_07200 [Domibacillus aminovorans]|uniref:Uncharacterized protein n=1 Tax=Domibacillus aminovorans TaxID=29332 RepID=A0A177KLX9_9BACI|nr:hypothetical protein AWH48_07200 [Domibacillus aminovorans]